MATNYSLWQPDPTELAALQEKADEALRMFNQSAPRAMDGETVASYRRRMAAELQPYAPSMKDINIYESAGSAFDLIEKEIYDGARREVNNPTMIPEGQLREVRKTDQSGRPYTEFHGKVSTWLSHFTGPRRKLIGIKTQTERGYIPNN